MQDAKEVHCDAFAVQDLRDQMHNDVKVLIDATTSLDGRDFTPGLIKFYGAYHIKSTGQIAIVLEYMSGGSLADILLKVKLHSRPSCCCSLTPN